VLANSGKVRFVVVEEERGEGDHFEKWASERGKKSRGSSLEVLNHRRSGLGYS